MAATKNPPANNQPEALKTFTNTVSYIDNLLAQIAAHRANHFGVDPEAITWGQVGEVQHFRSLLEEAALFICPATANA